MATCILGLLALGLVQELRGQLPVVLLLSCGHSAVCIRSKDDVICADKIQPDHDQWPYTV